MMKQRIKTWLTGVVVLLLAGVCSRPATAQDQGPSGIPVLGGHSFTESIVVPSPFVNSFIRNRLGGGQAVNLKFNVDEIGGVPVDGLRGSLLFAILDFEYQYAIKDWIALRMRMSGSGRLGSDTLALLSEGVTMSTGFEFGWLVRLQEREHSALSLDLNLTDRKFTGVNIARFIDDIVAGVPASLVNKTPSVRAGVGLRHAWAASPLLGLTTRAKTGYGESVERGRSDVWFWGLAAALDFDMRTKIPVPLGVAVGYAFDSFPEFGGDIEKGMHSTFVRLSYLGRDDFLFSLDVSGEKIPISGENPDLKGVSVTISMRYYI